MGLITKTKTWTDNENVTYTDINSNFDVVYNVVNGSLSNANVASDAAIAKSKLAIGDTDKTSITFVIGDGLTEISTGIAGFLEIPFDCTISAVTILADQSGSCIVDIWKDTYASFPPTDADSITASAPPTLSSATKNTDSTLSGWTTTITEGDILAFNVDSVTTCTRVTVALKVTKS